ncbi:flavodoxin family protein [Oscillospiraceae bacterium OttesenSCG-928-F05]|nr:flavodoxin family protein [Oscillospiraceae bacterium OttesenSCG-928-F05]
MKKAIAINGSPRRDGNASQMLDIAVQKATQVGYQIESYHLHEMEIAWCAGCMGCKKTGICVIHDDIDPIRDGLLSCDLAIIASPTYFANVSAPVKNMFDRLVGAIMDDNNSIIPKPKLSSRQEFILMTTCNTPFPLDRFGRQSSGCMKNMYEFFHTAGMKCRGKITFAGTRGKTQVPTKIVEKIERLF